MLAFIRQTLTKRRCLKQIKRGFAAILLIFFALISFSSILQAAITGDCNTDNRVDILDFQLLSNSFGKSSGQSGYNSKCDFNTDNNINIIDFQILSNNFGRTGTATVTPTRSVTPTSVANPTPTTMPHTPSPGGEQDCRGYPEPRAFLESQAWWWKRLPTQTGDDFGHVHFGTCFPHGQVVSGDIRFKVRLVMHDNPGRITQVHTWQNIADLNLTCPSGQTCVWWYEKTLSLSALGGSGRNEVRFHTHMNQPDGNQLFPTTGWQLYINSRSADKGDPVKIVKEVLAAAGRSNDVIIGRGWYTGSEYQNTAINKANIPGLSDPYQISSVAPDGHILNKVSGIWRPVVSASPGSGGSPTDHHIVMVDPNFHAMPPSNGWVIKEGSGELNSYQVTIDTTRLSNGWHKLAVRSDADDRGLCRRNDGSPCDSTLSSVTIIFFYVEN